MEEVEKLKAANANLEQQKEDLVREMEQVQSMPFKLSLTWLAS